VVPRAKSVSEIRSGLLSWQLEKAKIKIAESSSPPDNFIRLVLLVVLYESNINIVVFSSSGYFEKAYPEQNIQQSDILSKRKVKIVITFIFLSHLLDINAVF